MNMIYLAKPMFFRMMNSMEAVKNRVAMCIKQCCQISFHFAILFAILFAVSVLHDIATWFSWLNPCI